ncbi:MAG: peptidyl-prolyl cis-trans isomerase [Bacteroidota bacterium]
MVLGACSAAPEPDYVAKVGNQIITPEEFMLNYEFGFPQYKTGDNPKQTYLNKMIAELLLAEEGYRIQLDTLQRIRHGVATITEERLIEEVFQKRVMDNIRISEDELRDEINKSAVSFQFRYLPVGSERQGELVRQKAETEGFEAALASLTNDIGASPLTPDDVQSPYIQADQLDPELLSHLQDLPLNTLSDPIAYQGGWALFEITNIKRTPLSEYDYEQKSVSYRKILFNRKAMEGATEFVSGLMEPLEVRTKRPVFTQLNKAMFEWVQDEIPVHAAEKVRTGDKNYHTAIRKILPQVLVETSEHNWTVEEWLEAFNAGRYQLRPDNFDQFTSVFANVVALVIRDTELLEIADQEKLEQAEGVKSDIQAWSNKWVFQEMRRQVLDEVPFDNASVQAFFVERASTYGVDTVATPHLIELGELTQRRVRKDYLNYYLQLKIDELTNTYSITINDAVLDTIRVSGDQRIPVQLFKQNSNRPAFPVVDPNW